MSAGLSRSIRRIRPVERAKISTLFATAAATKSEDMLNCRDTRSILNMGSEASSCMLLVLGGAYPLVMSYAILGRGIGSLLLYACGHILRDPLLLFLVSEISEDSVRRLVCCSGSILTASVTPKLAELGRRRWSGDMPALVLRHVDSRFIRANVHLRLGEMTKRWR